MSTKASYSKRRYKRIPMNEGVFYTDKGSQKSGKLLDCSAEGMLIETQVSDPVNPDLEIVISTGNERLHVPAKVVRMYKKYGVRTKLGVKVLGNENKYIQFVLRSAVRDVSE